MNRSDLMPEDGRRFHRIRKLSRFLSGFLFSALVLSFLGYSTVAEHYRLPTVTEPHPETSPISPDKPSSDTNDPPQISLSLFPSEPSPVLGIYDLLFGQNEASVPSGELKIVNTDLSKNPKPGEVFLKNSTTYSISVTELLSPPVLSLPTVSRPASEEDPPLVLIYHSHGTEGYADEGVASYPSSALPRSRDTDRNVVAVGRVLADTLNRLGIRTLHCETMHDATSYTNAYTHSAQALRQYLEEYPSIRYAFDIHRDALVGSNEVYKTVTYDEGTPVAQVMLVVGTDAAGAVHDGWRRNLTFAVNTQYLLSMHLPTVARPISVTGPSYNQQYPFVGLLIEVGTCVNTLAEAKASAEILGENLAALITAQSAA